MDISDKLVAAAMKNLEKLLISKGFTAESLLSKFDIDTDGKINIDEFDAGLTRLTGSSAPRSYLRPIFSAIDTNGSGFLEQNELMALLGIENKTSINSSSLNISGHVNEKYNGDYSIQGNNINGKNWYMNSNGCRLYFYNANDGGAPSWSLDDREQNGTNDWYGGGWTRVPADGNIPLGVRRFVGAGKITISEVFEQSTDGLIGIEGQQESKLDKVELVDEEFDITDFVESLSSELQNMIEDPSSIESIDASYTVINDKFEEEVSQLPVITQAPIRALWKIKSDAVVTIAKTQLSTNNANIVTGLGIAGAAVGAVSSISKEDVQQANMNQVTKTSSQAWHDSHDVDPPDRVEVPDRVTVNEPLSQLDSTEPLQEIAAVEEIIPEKSVNEPSIVVSDNNASQLSTFSLEEIVNQMNEARFLNEQRELLSQFKGKVLELSFRVNSIDRTFGIGISEEYKGGETLLVTSNSYHIEVRMKKGSDTSKILSGTEIKSDVSIADWNGIRKRLVVNHH
tara:strand:- start:846 stop:2378 length:1533 start_codon:yes stop_codon:yes gene_type:complete